MKRRLLCCVMILLLTVSPTLESKAAWWYIVKEVIKKVLKAMDVAVQQLQNKTIWLQNAQKQLENTMSELKLKEISEWTEKQREQYAKYYDELRKVKELLAGYHAVKQIIAQQAAIAEEYKRAMRIVRADTRFSLAEIDYMEKVYSGIVSESLKNLDELFLVVKEFTQMTDGKRLAIINRVAERIQTNLDDLRAFNRENMQVSLQRSGDSNDVLILQKLYGL